MADLRTDSLERIAEIRRRAVADLKNDIPSKGQPFDLADHLSAIARFGVSLLDAEAAELLNASDNKRGFADALNNDVLPRIIGFLPNPIEVAYDEAIRKYGPDGTLVPESDRMPRHKPHEGEWESSLPQHALFLLNPQNSGAVRDMLKRSLLWRVYYWLGRFSLIREDSKQDSEPLMVEKLSEAAVIRINIATAGFFAEFIPQLEAAQKDIIRCTELLQSVVVHQVNLVARECMAICESAQDFVRRLDSEFGSIASYGLEPWGGLAKLMLEGTTFMRTNTVLWKARQNLISEAWEHAQEVGFYKSHVAVSQCSDFIGTSPSSQAPHTTDIIGNRRLAVAAFIKSVSQAGRKITRKTIWTFAGYKHPTEFERFQRNDTRTTRSAITNFSRILNMAPEKLIELLDKKK